MGNACSRIKLLLNDYYVKLNDKKKKTPYSTQEQYDDNNNNTSNNTVNDTGNNVINNNNPYNYDSRLCNCKYKNNDQSNKKVLICEYCYDRLDTVLFI